MLQLDHCVIQIDADMAALQTLKHTIAPLGYPFEPTRGKGTRGFKVADLFVGKQYCELVWLKRPDGGGWRADWVARYNQGQRGAICLMLLTDQLDNMCAAWRERGLHLSAPERISFTILGPLLRMSLPWRNAYLGPIPGTVLQIGLQQMDSTRILERMQRRMQPNAAASGITGFRRAVVHHNFAPAAWTFLQTAFPHAQSGDNHFRVALDAGMELVFVRTEQQRLVELQAISSNPAHIGASFSIADVLIRTVGA